MKQEPETSNFCTLDNLPENYDPWGCLSYTVITIIVMAAIFLSLLTSCTTKQIVSDNKQVQIETIHDTLREYHITHDSVYTRDSVFSHTYTQGDTVYVVNNKIQLQYRDRVQHDTINNPVVQTKYITRTETMEVEKQTFWDKLGIAGCGLCFTAICIFLIMTRVFAKK